MPPTTPVRPKPFRRLTIVVCLAAAIVAGLLGSLASFLYESTRGHHDVFLPLIQVGRWWGAASGLLAGAIRCRLMTQLATSQHHRELGLWGALVGAGVGLLSTILLHLGIRISADRWEHNTIALGLAFGIPAGAALGVVCGYVLRGSAGAASADAATTLTDAPHDPPDAAA